MHELGIAQNIIDIAEREAASRQAIGVIAVGLRIGEFSGVESESLRFCFDCLKAGTRLARAELCIESTAADELDVAYLEVEDP